MGPPFLFQPLTNCMVRKHFLVSDLASCNLDPQFLIPLPVDIDGCLFLLFARTLQYLEATCFPGLTEQSQLFSISSQAMFSRAVIFLLGSSLESLQLVHMQVCSCFLAVNYTSFHMSLSNW